MKKFFTLLLTLSFLLPCFLEAQVVPVRLIISDDAGVNITMDGMKANFGPNFPASLTAPVAWATDGITAPTDGDVWSEVGAYTCEAVSNPDDIAGKIAFISRGACEFGVKVLNAEEAGAVAAIIGNRAPFGLMVGTHVHGLIWMGAGAVGDSTTIPSMFIAYEDRVILENMIAENPNLDITIEQAYLYDAAVTRAYNVPNGQTGVADSIQLVVINRDTTPLLDVTFTVDITEPDGNVVSFSTTLDSLIPPAPGSNVSAENLILFDAYNPSMPGSYSAVFSAATTSGDHDLDSETITTSFEVNENATFSLDNGGVGNYPGIQLNEVAYTSSANLAFNVGSLYTTGAGGEAIGATFALDNPGELAEDMTFNLILYDADPDGDGDIDNDANGAVDQDDLYIEAVASGSYTLTGGESAGSLLNIEFDSPATLAENHTYLLMLTHDGVESDNFVSPSYTIAGYSTHTNYNTVVEAGQLGSATYLFEIDGFEYWNDDTPGFPHGGAHPVLRLHMSGFVGVDDLPVLDAAQVHLLPNPAKDYVSLQLDLENRADKVEVNIISADGKVLHQESLENVQSDVFDINISNLPAGIHFVHVLTAEGYRTKLLSVVK